MKYGIPYMGSKNTIAEQVVKAIPRCGRFLDACCGGGAIMQAAAMSGRFDHVVANDNNPAIVKLLDAILIHKGQIDYEHPTPCTRIDFFNSLQRIENGDFNVQDCLNKYCASFGNDGASYLYGRHLEEVKICAENMLTAGTLEQRRLAYKKFIEHVSEGKFDDDRLNNLSQLNQIESLSKLQRLENVERVGQFENSERLERLERIDNNDIFEIDFSDFDVIYFDIPYKGTHKYDFKFDYDRFYDMFANLGKPAFLSEYNAPFTCVLEIDKCSKMNCTGSTKKIECLEKLYFNGTIDEYKALMGREFQPIGLNQQQTLFDWMDDA